MNNIGLMYETSLGVPQDYVQAHLWYTRAVSRFEPGPRREDAARNRDRVAARMGPDELAEAERLARGKEWASETPTSRGRTRR